MKKIINSDKAPAPIGPYSQAVAANGMVFTSGQIAIDAATGEMVNSSIAEETRKVMANMAAVLEAANSSFDQVVSTSIFLKDMDDFAAMNEVYASYFETDPPARATVQVSRLPKDVAVEISMIALTQ